MSLSSSQRDRLCKLLNANHVRISRDPDRTLWKAETSNPAPSMWDWIRVGPSAEWLAKVGADPDVNWEVYGVATGRRLGRTLYARESAARREADTVNRAAGSIIMDVRQVAVAPAAPQEI